MNKKTVNNRIHSRKLVDDIRVRDLSRIPNVEYRTEKNVLYFGLKLTLLTVVVFFVALSFSSVGSTVSFYRNVEKSIGNFMQADPLSFKVAIENESDGSSSATVDMLSGETILTPIMTPDEASEPIQYFVKSEFTGGDSDLCNSIQVLSTFPFPHNGSLAGLITSTSTSVGAWTLEFSLPDASLFANKSCMMDLVYEGWNATSPYGKGYRDVQKFSITFTVPEVFESNLKISLPETLVETPPEETEEIPSIPEESTTVEEAPSEPTEPPQENPEEVEETIEETTEVEVPETPPQEETPPEPPAEVEAPPAETLVETPAETTA